MGISGSNTWRYVSTIFLAIFCWDSPLHRPYIGLIYGRYLQFRFLRWPLTVLLVSTSDYPSFSREVTAVAYHTIWWKSITTKHCSNTSVAISTTPRNHTYPFVEGKRTKSNLVPGRSILEQHVWVCRLAICKHRETPNLSKTTISQNQSSWLNLYNLYSYITVYSFIITCVYNIYICI